jgi:hypothetical protein
MVRLERLRRTASIAPACAATPRIFEHHEAVAAELLRSNASAEPGKRKLVETRTAVEDGWRSVASRLAKDGHYDLANDVQRFVDRMPAPKTEC